MRRSTSSVDDHSVLRARAEALRALIASDAERDEEALEHGERALALAEQLGAGDVVADVTATMTRVLARTGGTDLPKARKRYDELIATSRADGDVRSELRGLHNLAFVLLNAGELDDAEAAFRGAMARAEATGRAWAPYGFDGRAYAGIICYLRGRWDDALELQTAGRGAPMLAEVILAGGALLVAAGRGEDAALSEAPRVQAMWRRDIALAVHSGAALIDLHGDRGDLPAARAAHRDVVSCLVDFWNGQHFAAHLRLGGLVVGQMASAAAQLSRAEQLKLLADVAVLERDIAEVVEASPRMGPEGHAWRLRFAAECARLRWVAGVDAPSQGDLTRLWRDAHRAFASFGQPFEEARSAVRLASVLLAGGDDEQAHALLASARETARALGARPLLREIAALGRPRAAGPDQLTPREREVLQQVAAGRVQR